MLTSHALILKFRHDPRFSFTKVRIWYVDRGAPEDCSQADGDCIILDAYYLKISSADGEKYIPYHRVRRIFYAGVPVWERKIRPKK